MLHRHLFKNRAICASAAMIAMFVTSGAAAGGGSDDCAKAQQIAGDGLFFFDNSTATTDGLPILDCFPFGIDQIDNDVWFCWTASGNGEVLVETCGLTEVDTRIAAYDGCTCPEGNGILACNDYFCALQSQISFSVVKGQQYLLRIGNFPNASGGTGSFNIQTTVTPGACCLNTDCLITTPGDCAAQGGNYQGDGASCGGGDPLNFEASPNINIPDADPAGVSHTINVPDSIIIGDVKVDLTIIHTWVGDLCVSVEHDGVVVNLIQRPGANNGIEPCHLEGPFGCPLDNYDGIVLDDVGAGGPIEDACALDLTSPPNYVPNEALNAFFGMDSSGDWTITVSDNASLDFGTLNSWSLSIQEPDCPDPNPCPWDLDGSGSVGASDLLSLLVQWGTDPGGPPDFDGDGKVGASDLLSLLANWGPCP